MPEPDHYTAVRYLMAKAAVDDDALNDVVLGRLEDYCGERGMPFLRVIELGAGVGSTYLRMLDNLLTGIGHYTMVDLDAESLVEAQRVADENPGYAKPGAFVVDTVVEDAIGYLKRQSGVGSRADLIVAQALIDLLNVPTFLAAAFDALEPGGYLYLPITFDGETVFGPQIDADLDKRVVGAYHATMDARRTPDGVPTGGSRAGQSLLRALPEAGLELVEEGPSDWEVVPQDGAYPQDVAYFLHHIINFVWESLREGAEIPVDALQGWVAERHAQIERGELVYIARQIDVLARKPN